MQTITVNDKVWRVVNDTDYYLDEWLYSDYGFDIIVPKSNDYWGELGLLQKSTRRDFVGAYSTEYKHRSIRLDQLVTFRKGFVEWCSGGYIYEMLWKNDRIQIGCGNDLGKLW